MRGDQTVKVGDEAPDFTLPSADGEPVTLSAFRGKSAVVLFFYPKDNSPACTLEACAFRDSFEYLKEKGVEIVGVSTDSEPSHRRFARSWNLPFRLLSDREGEVRARYGLAPTLGIFPRRVTYLIDRAGIVRHIVSSQLQPSRHVREILGRLDELTTGGEEAP